MFPIIFTLFLLLTFPSWASADKTSKMITSFSTGTLHGWEEKKFKGFTQYEFVFDNHLHKKVLKAEVMLARLGFSLKQK